MDKPFWQKKIVQIASAICDSKCDLVEGVRQLDDYLVQMPNPLAEYLHPILDVAMDLDEIPSPSSRALYSAEYLAKADATRREITETRGDAIRKACREILERFS